MAKSAARELIDRLGSRCAQSRRRHRTWDIGFATTSLQSLVYNAQPGAVAYAETPDVLGLFAWLLRDQLLAKINAGFDEIADDKSALNQAQREEAEAQISAHRSRVTTSSEGGDEPDRAPGRLACLLPPGSTGAGWATSRATYHEPRCRARGCSTAHWQGGSHGLSCQARASTDRALWPTNRDGKSRSVAQAGWFGYVGPPRPPRRQGNATGTPPRSDQIR